MRRKKGIIITRPVVRTHPQSKKLSFFEECRVERIFGGIPDRGAVGEMGENKGTIQSKKSLRRCMLIERAINNTNDLSSFRTNGLNMQKPREVGGNDGTEIFKRSNKVQLRVV